MDSLKQIIVDNCGGAGSIEEIARTPKLEELEARLADESVKKEFHYVEELLFEIKGQLMDHKNRLKNIEQAIEAFAQTLYGPQP